MLIRFFSIVKKGSRDQQILSSSVENSYFLKSRCETVLLSLHTTLLKMLEHILLIVTSRTTQKMKFPVAVNDGIRQVEKKFDQK